MAFFTKLRTFLGFFIVANNASLADSATLFTGGTVIAWSTPANKLEIIRNGSVLVEGDTIKAVYSGAYNGTLPSDLDTVDATNDIISTGFIDTHRHSWQTAFKTLGSNTTLFEYFSLYGASSPANTAFTPEDIYIGQLIGLIEAWNAGVTTIVDFAHHSWSEEHAREGLRATLDSGIRAVYAYNLGTYPNFTWNQSVQTFRSFTNDTRFKDSPVELGISYDGFSPSMDQIVVDQTQDVITLAKEFNVSLVTTHSNGGVYGGSNSPEHVHQLGFLNQSDIPLIFAHASYMNVDSAKLLRQTNHYISITAESEMHYGHDHPNSHLIQDQASLGVDTHFTFSTDILTQARIWLQCVRQVFYREVINRRNVPANSPMSVTQAFLLGTRNGALALHRSDIGILAPGAKADLLVWNGRAPSLLGWSDPVAAIMLHANVGNIKHVMVDGKLKKKDGQLMVDNYEKLQERFLQSANRMQNMWKEIPLPVLEGEASTGSEFERTEEADVLRGEGTGY